MPETKKKENYSADTTKRMIEVYQAASDDEARADAMLQIQEFTGKTIASIRSKLATEGVYKAKAKPVGKGGSRVTKANMVSDIAAQYPSATSGFFDSMEGCNKNLITFFADHLRDEADQAEHVAELLEAKADESRREAAEQPDSEETADSEGA